MTSVRAGDGLGAIRERIHRLLLDRAEALGLHVVTGPERRLRVREQAFGLLREEGVILSQAALTRLINEVSDQVVGFGPIEFLLKDPEVIEVARAMGPTLRQPPRPAAVALAG